MISSAVRPSTLHSRITSDGGFTLRLRDGGTPRRGISVCTRPAAACSFALAAWDDRVVARWLSDRVDGGDRYIGGWLDDRTNTVWLDVVGVMSPRFGPLACLVGRLMAQHCVFDLGRGETVLLHGGAS